MDVTPRVERHEDRIMETPGSEDNMQPNIRGDGDFSQPRLKVEEDVEMLGGDDMADEEEKDLTEDELRKLQKVDSVATINSLRMKPKKTFRLSIPLCKMVAMPMVRPTFSCGIQFLKREFIGGYRDGATVFYVSTTNEAGDSLQFTKEEMDEWSPPWKRKNAEFEDILEADPALKYLKNSKFFVCGGNHKLLAWMNVISRMHADNYEKHYAVDSILLNTKGKVELVMQVMHDINK